MTQVIQLGFDYGSLDTETGAVVQQEDKDFDRNMDDAGTSFILACHNLKRIQEALRYGHPGFVDYCASKNGLEKSTAYRMLDVAEMFPKLGNISIENRSVLYLLSAPSVPQAARDEVIEAAGYGERVTVEQAKRVIAAHKIEQAPPEGKVTVAHVERTVEEYKDAPVPHVAHNSGDNEWYTPSEYILSAVKVMGAIDLDPASSQEANVIVNAAHYFDAEIDGLACEWSGRVWMNPPYSGDVMGRFCAKLRSSFESGQVTEAIVLVNNATETRWFQDLCARASALCFPSGRIRYWKPNKETNTPLQGQTFVYLGENAHQFIDEFKHFGMVCNVIR